MDMNVVLFYYLYSYLPFVLELAVAEGLFVFRMRRKPLFVVRLLSGAVVLAGGAFLVTVAAQLLDAWWWGALSYIVVFFGTLIVLKVCFDEPFKLLIFCGVAAYAVQNLAYRVGSLLEITGCVWRLSLLVGYSAASNIVNYGVFILSCVFAWFLFVRRMKSRGLESIYNRNVLFLSVVTLAVTVLLCSFTNSWWWQSWWLSITNYCFAILCNLFILVIQSGMLENVGLRSDIETIRRMWEQDRRQYELAKENIELINIRCHDMRHRIRQLRLSDDSVGSEELKELESCVAIYDSKVNTGCKPLDVLLTEKSLYCNDKGIRISCMADGAALSFMSEYDLYSLFGNMLSNAVEAAIRVQDKEKRIIDLTVSRARGMVFVQCSNYYEGDISLVDDLPKTHKEDAEQHGFGMKSMKLLVRKYGGEFSYAYDEDTFRIKIFLPVQRERRERRAEETERADAPNAA